MGAVTGESLHHTVEQVTTWICPEPGRRQPPSLLASGGTSGWTEALVQLSLTSLCIMQTLTCSVWSGVYYGFSALLSLGGYLHIYFWRCARKTSPCR